MLTKYGLERVLYRIAQSKHRELFVLKGALLFELWTEQRYRPTRDADFLARGANRPERFAEIFKEICNAEVEDDGLRFAAATLTAERIAEDPDYEGVRVKLVGYLENARIPIQIDPRFWRCNYACAGRGRIANSPQFSCGKAVDLPNAVRCSRECRSHCHRELSNIEI